jgi:hypothetical protein
MLILDKITGIQKETYWTEKSVQNFPFCPKKTLENFKSFPGQFLQYTTHPPIYFLRNNTFRNCTGSNSFTVKAWQLQVYYRYLTVPTVFVWRRVVFHYCNRSITKLGKRAIINKCTQGWNNQYFYCL